METYCRNTLTNTGARRRVQQMDRQHSGWQTSTSAHTSDRNQPANTRASLAFSIFTHIHTVPALKELKKRVFVHTVQRALQTFAQQTFTGGEPRLVGHELYGGFSLVSIAMAPSLHRTRDKTTAAAASDLWAESNRCHFREIFFNQ